MTIFWTKFLHNVKDPILKDLWKFQVDTPINAKVTAVQSFENPHTLYCGSHDGGQENAHQPIFAYNIIENSQTSFARNSGFFGPNDFNLVQRHVLWSHRPYQNLGQIDYNLHNHVSDDVICKPPIDKSLLS